MQRKIKFSPTAVLVCCLLTASLVSQWRLLARALVSISIVQAQPEATLSGSIADAFGGKLADATIRLYSAD